MTDDATTNQVGSIHSFFLLECKRSLPHHEDRPLSSSLTDTIDSSRNNIQLYQVIFQYCRSSSSSSNIMVWPFCPSCRATLTIDNTGKIHCQVCPYQSNLSEMTSDQLPNTITTSANRPIPLWAKSDEEQAALHRSSEPVRATIEEPCVKCGQPEVGYYTVQLRSVDEGQTVFYECPKCKHNWSVNN